MIKGKEDAVRAYNNLVKSKSIAEDNMSNLQREKDYKVQCIEKKYESRINVYINQIDYYNLEIEKVKKYIKEH